MAPQLILMGTIAVLAFIAGQWWLAVMAIPAMLYFGYLAANEMEEQAD